MPLFVVFSVFLQCLLRLIDVDIDKSGRGRIV